MGSRQEGPETDRAPASVPCGREGRQPVHPVVPLPVCPAFRQDPGATGPADPTWRLVPARFLASVGSQRGRQQAWESLCRCCRRL